jgi:hypothetical protein
VKIILIKAVFDLEARIRLLSLGTLKQEHGIYHYSVTNRLIRKNGDVVGLLKEV